MNGQLISITISDKSLVLHTTDQNDATSHVLQLLAVYGQIAQKRLVVALPVHLCHT